MDSKLNFPVAVPFIASSLYVGFALALLWLGFNPLIIVGLIILPIVLIGAFIREELLIYMAVLLGIFYTPFYPLTFRFIGILLIPTDLLFLLILAIGFARKLMTGSSKVNSRLFVITGIVAIIILYGTFLGALQGNYWKTVFRETKLIIYYGAIPIFIGWLLKSKIQLKHIFFFVLISATAGSLYDLYARIFDIYTVSAFAGGVEGVITYADTPFGKIIRDYGWVSTFHYQVFACLIGLVFILWTKSWSKRVLFIILTMINLIANLLTVTRGFMFGLLMGGASLILFISIQVNERNQVQIGKLIKRAVSGVMLLAIIIIVAAQIVPSVQASFYRFLTIVDARYAGAGDIGNISLRLSSIQLGIETAWTNPLGMGFGIESPSETRTEAEGRILYLLYHNSLGYILYIYGLFFGVFILLLLLSLALSISFQVFRAEQDDKMLLSILGTNYVALLAMSFTTGNFLFAVDNVLPYAVILMSGILYYRVK